MFFCIADFLRIIGLTIDQRLVKKNKIGSFLFFVCLQVEGLLDEKDFRSPVTRAELEHLSEDLFDRITKPIEDALKVSEITLVRNYFKP